MDRRSRHRRPAEQPAEQLRASPAAQPASTRRMEVTVEPLAPEWRTLGTATARVPGPAAGSPAPARTVVITPRLVAWIAGLLVAAALVGGALFLALLPSGGGVVIESSLTDRSTAGLPATDLITTDRSGTGAADPQTGVDRSGATLSLGDLVVDVEGAVVHPGLVHVPAGGRVGDALARAGGFAPNADLTRTASELNLAQQVTDGLKVVVPVMGQQAQGANAGVVDGPGAAGSPARSAGPVDLNNSTEAELDALPGVGPATIAKIVAAREASPFQSAEDLRTRGIVGEAAYAKLQGLVTAGR